MHSRETKIQSVMIFARYQCFNIVYNGIVGVLNSFKWSEPIPYDISFECPVRSIMTGIEINRIDRETKSARYQCANISFGRNITIQYKKNVVKFNSRNESSIFLCRFFYYDWKRK